MAIQGHAMVNRGIEWSTWVYRGTLSLFAFILQILINLTYVKFAFPLFQGQKKVLSSRLDC